MTREWTLLGVWVTYGLHLELVVVGTLTTDVGKVGSVRLVLDSREVRERYDGFHHTSMMVEEAKADETYVLHLILVVVVVVGTATAIDGRTVTSVGHLPAVLDSAPRGQRY